MSKQFTVKEVIESEDNTSNLIIIDNNVYNVAPFLNEHPGGEEVLLDQRGKNATEQFEDVGHSTEARELMKKYQVGTISDPENVPASNQGSSGGGSFENPNKFDFSKSKEEDSGMPAWLVPAIFGVLVVLLYQYLL
uniref:Cytochrome b5 n=1 Tax=Cacopsylla melanoneura TaxID=428564 RepID=A0A8D8UW04_9HEMI